MSEDAHEINPPTQTECPLCKRVCEQFKAVSESGGDRIPRINDIIICYNCGEPLLVVGIIETIPPIYTLTHVTHALRKRLSEDEQFEIRLAVNHAKFRIQLYNRLKKSYSNQ
jgi:hypothetical protein